VAKPRVLRGRLFSLSATRSSYSWLEGVRVRSADGRDEHEIVPDSGEDDGDRRGDRRSRGGDHDPKDHPEAGAAVDARRQIQVPRHCQECRAQQVDEDRRPEGRIQENETGDRVADVEPDEDVQDRDGKRDRQLGSVSTNIGNCRRQRRVRAASYAAIRRPEELDEPATSASIAA
jgi:hypothetical protein